MQIFEAAPKREPKRARVTYRRDYKVLFNRLMANEGKWLAVNPADVSGATISRKQTSLYLSAKLRKIKIETTAQDGLIYIRTRREEATNA